MLPKYLKFTVCIRIIIAFTARTIKKVSSLFLTFIVEKKLTEIEWKSFMNYGIFRMNSMQRVKLIYRNHTFN